MLQQENHGGSTVKVKVKRQVIKPLGIVEVEDNIFQPHKGGYIGNAHIFKQLDEDNFFEVRIWMPKELYNRYKNQKQRYNGNGIFCSVVVDNFRTIRMRSKHPEYYLELNDFYLLRTI